MADLDELRRLRRARDRMDRELAEPLDVAALARTALMSTAHYSRRFRDTYGETRASPGSWTRRRAPTARDHEALARLPGRLARVLTRPRKGDPTSSSFRSAPSGARLVSTA